MKAIRQRLGWKLFLSYFIIIVVGVVSLGLAAEFHAPSALNRHMASMEGMMGDNMGGMITDLNQSFRTAVNEILFVAAAIAMVTAVAVSTFITRRIVNPIQQMKEASQRIADGRYQERVQIISEDELGELARAFNQMAHTLAQTEQRRRQLIGDVAHELRTPLSSIKGVMEGLQDGVLPPEPATFINVQQEVSRLQRLVRDLEELSRAEARQLSLEMALVNPAEFVETAVARLHLQFEDKGVQLRQEIAPTLPLVQADVGRMAQVVLNLLGNALQYTPAGGQVTIHCSVISNPLSVISNPLSVISNPLSVGKKQLNGEHCLLISVADTGIGLTAEHLRHIFERFYRVDKSRSRAGGGSGIGLTISKYLVEAHNGRITAASPGPNQGSTFTVTLPVA